MIPLRGGFLIRRTSSFVRRSSSTQSIRWKLQNDGLELRDFLRSSSPERTTRRTKRLPKSGFSIEAAHIDPERTDLISLGKGSSVYIETKGCQMNVADTEIVRTFLVKDGFTLTCSQEDADIVLINTCAVRDHAERKIWQFLRNLRGHERNNPKTKRKTIGLLGCMAERLKSSLLTSPERLVDAVVGPDAYRSLPLILSSVMNGQPGAVGYNVQLSAETYADITPMRESSSRSSAFVSISRGCSNMCAFCIVPFTRGRERSRPYNTIIDEVTRLSDAGFKEVTLLGQNVNSYNYVDPSEDRSLSAKYMPRAKGFGTVYKTPVAGVRFPELVDNIAAVNPEMRIRFTSPHPKDFPDDLLHVIASRPNVCNQIHMPAQSGSTAVLERMNRRYTAEAYRDLADHIRKTIPGVALSSDFIAGFCGETEDDHCATLNLLRHVQYEQGFFFAYSRRNGTAAARKLEDDVPDHVKQRRLRELIDTFHQIARRKNFEEEVSPGSLHCVLVEGRASRCPDRWAEASVAWSGRTDTNKRVVLRDAEVPLNLQDSQGEGPRVHVTPGEYFAVKIVDATSLTLFAEPIARTTLTEFDSCAQMDWKAREAPGLLLG